jgi:hypothetical protein
VWSIEDHPVLVQDCNRCFYKSARSQSKKRGPKAQADVIGKKLDCAALRLFVTSNLPY